MSHTLAHQGGSILNAKPGSVLDAKQHSAANVLDGSAGADALIGGAGNDTYVIDNTGDVVTENSGEGTDTVQSSVSFTLSSEVENLLLTGSSAINGTGNDSDNILTGNSGANTLTGNGGIDTLDGGAGADQMTGGNGDDIYFVDNSSDVVTESSGEGTDTVQSSITWTLGSNLENLTLTGSSAINGTGNSSDNVITGTSGVNTLTGNGGNDTLAGGAGADTLVGGTGNDIYFVDNSSDVVTESSGEGTDTVQSAVTWTLGSTLENLTLIGSSAINGTGNSSDNGMTGNSGANTLTGNGGSDYLDGGAGADTLIGGADGDTYVVDNAGDVVTDASGGGGTDTVQSSVTWTLGSTLENLTLTGSSAINGTGNSKDNILIGNSGVNTLTGDGGNDTIEGGAGNDTLVGGSGADTFVFATSFASNNVDVIDDFGGADKLYLDDDIFDALAGLGTSPFILSSENFAANVGGTAEDANDFILYNTSNGRLYYDADGSGEGAKILFADLTGDPSLVASDITIIG